MENVDDAEDNKLDSLIFWCARDRFKPLTRLNLCLLLYLIGASIPPPRHSPSLTLDVLFVCLSCFSLIKVLSGASRSVTVT